MIAAHSSKILKKIICLFDFQPHKTTFHNPHNGTNTFLFPCLCFCSWIYAKFHDFSSQKNQLVYGVSLLHYHIRLEKEEKKFYHVIFIIYYLICSQAMVNNLILHNNFFLSSHWAPQLWIRCLVLEFLSYLFLISIVC